MILQILDVSAILLIAGLGELISERSGVLNIGVEGMMIMGSLSSIVFSKMTGNPWIGLLMAMIGGGVLSILHGILSISFNVEQTVSGMGIWLFGIGLTAYVGSAFTGTHSHVIPAVVWGLTPLFFIALALVPLAWFLLFKTSFGLNIRTVGEDPSVAEVLGINIKKIRYICVFIGGMLAGLSGAYLSLVYAPIWSRRVTAGRGWLALSLVAFSLWRPFILLLGSFMFGFLWIFSIKLQFLVALPTSLLRTIPFVSAIITLIIISSERFGARLRQPAALGKPYIPEK